MNDTVDFAALIQVGEQVGINLNDAKLNDAKLPAKLKATANFKLIVSRVQLAWSLHDTMCLVTGANGCGKSTAVNFFAKQDNVLLINTPLKPKPQTIVHNLAKILGVDAGSAWRAQTDTVISQLLDDPKLIIWDEAQRLDYDCLDALKYIGEESDTTFVLVSNSNLERIIERHADIDSRVGTRVRVGAMGMDEFLALYRDEGYSDPVLSEMHKLTAGVYRRINRLMVKLQAAMQEADLTPSTLKVGHLRHLAREVLQ